MDYERIDEVASAVLRDKVNKSETNITHIMYSFDKDILISAPVSIQYHNCN